MTKIFANNKIQDENQWLTARQLGKIQIFIFETLQFDRHRDTNTHTRTHRNANQTQRHTNQTRKHKKNRHTRRHSLTN